MVIRITLATIALMFSLSANAAQWQHERGAEVAMPQMQLILPQHAIYQRGQAIILYQFTSSSRFFNLRSGDLQFDGGDSERIPHSVTQLGAQRYRHTLGWVVHPRQAGEFTLALPDVEYLQSGVVQYRLHSKPIHLQVLPLPGYLPRHMPVGEMRMSVVDAPWWLRVGDALLLQVVIQTDGISDRLYRPAPPSLFAEDAASDTVQLQDLAVTVDEKGTHTRYRYLVPLTVTHAGLLWSQQTLQWFNPQHERVEQQVFRLGPVVMLAQWQFVLVSMVFALLLFWWLYKLQQRLRYRWRQLRVYRKLLERLPRLQQAQQLREVLDQLAVLEGLSSGLPVSNLWLYFFASLQQGKDEFQALQLALYHQGNMHRARQVLVHLMYKHMGWWRIFLRRFSNYPAVE